MKQSSAGEVVGHVIREDEKTDIKELKKSAQEKE